MSDERWSNPPKTPDDDGRTSSYWRGTYHDTEVGAAEGPAKSSGYGALSDAARRSYANEAIRQKDHVSACLFAVFLGLFGVHKFYLGYNKQGFIMLAMTVIGGICTLGLAAAVIWLIAIVEGIIYLTKSQTDFDRIYVQGQRDWF